MYVYVAGVRLIEIYEKKLALSLWENKYWPLWRY